LLYHFILAPLWLILGLAGFVLNDRGHSVGLVIGLLGAWYFYHSIRTIVIGIDKYLKELK